MSNHRTPLEVVEALIGRPERIGEVVGVHPKSPYQWRDGSGLRLAGDIPYAAHQRALLAYAAARGIPLTADHLIWGASEDELARLVAEVAARAPETGRAA